MSNQKYQPKSSEQSPLDQFSLEDADDLGPKCACVLVLDVSNSMAGARIDALNQGLAAFQKDMESRDLVRHRVDVAVVTFGLEVTVAQTFIPAADFSAATLTVDGTTPMAEAVQTALDLIDERKDFYRQRGNPVYRPWVFLITDGAPTDEEEDWQAAVKRVHEAEKSKSVIFWAIGVEGAELKKLKEISVRAPWKLKGLKFAELFLWLSNSLGAVSGSTPGEEVQLERPSSDFVV